MAAQADQQTALRIKDFMKTLHEAKAEWGIFHMLIAQTVLCRPIHLAQPVEDAPYWHVEPINDIIADFVFEDDIDMPEAPPGKPLILLPTRMSRVRVPLTSNSHWDPLLPVPIEQKSEDGHKYAQRQSAVALDKEKSKAEWHAALRSDPNMYGGLVEKEAFLEIEEKAMQQRSQDWGKQAVSLRENLDLQPARVDGDGAYAGAGRGTRHAHGVHKLGDGEKAAQVAADRAVRAPAADEVQYEGLHRRAEPVRANFSLAGPRRAEPSESDSSRAKPHKTKSNRAEPNRL